MSSQKLWISLIIFVPLFASLFSGPAAAGGTGPDAGMAAASACALGGAEIDQALLPATRAEALPDGYVPPDLVPLSSVGIPQRGYWEVRQVLITDLEAMVQAAVTDRAQLWVASGYRSYQVQAQTHAYWVRLLGADAADRGSARPGHSQHQLGTAIDFNLGSGFADSASGQWLWDHAHEYGFVFPYTRASRSSSGYIFEPWHVRWIGRPLAGLMWAEGYQNSDDLNADDYVAAARSELVRAGFANACGLPGAAG
ncbi:MAG: D-alanyl-D-alanine carboxypeptidase family protein [Chloroflexi bacterium]|nr:D-alanyl-D-alanine carboxypeptidase family protein [Chloroflexota bacterium]